MSSDGERRRPPAIAVALVCAFVAAVSLVLPWLAIGGGPARSTIDLIGSAGALDLLRGGERVAVIAAWTAAPIAVAIALVAAPFGRRRLAAAVVAVVGLVLVVAAVLIVTNDFVRLGWGGVVGGVAGAGAMVFGTLEFRGGRITA